MISKKATDVLVGKQLQEEGFTIVYLDEPFLFRDSLARRVFWIDEKKRHLVRVTGSHKIPNMHFWSLESGGKKSSCSGSTMGSMETLPGVPGISS